jgi:predicted nucleic acid-binding protein
MKSTDVCVDASLAIKVVVPEAGSDLADALFDQWAGEEIQLIAPVFFEVETDSILRQKALLRRELTADQAQRAFASLRALPIQTRHSAEQRERAGKSLASFNSLLSTTPHIFR